MKNLPQQLTYCHSQIINFLLPFCQVIVVYYIIPTTGSHSYSSGQDCHTLSYYINNVAHFSSNIMLILIEGEYVIGANELNDLNNVTLQRQYQWIQGSNWSVMMSTIIIKYFYNVTTAIIIFNTTMMCLKDIAITNCCNSVMM